MQINIIISILVSFDWLQRRTLFCFVFPSCYTAFTLHYCITHTHLKPHLEHLLGIYMIQKSGLSCFHKVSEITLQQRLHKTHLGQIQKKLQIYTINNEKNITFNLKPFYSLILKRNSFTCSKIKSFRQVGNAGIRQNIEGKDDI